MLDHLCFAGVRCQMKSRLTVADTDIDATLKQKIYNIDSPTIAGHNECLFELLFGDFGAGGAVFVEITLDEIQSSNACCSLEIEGRPAFGQMFGSFWPAIVETGIDK